MTSIQKKLAAKILKRSAKRIWIDPARPKVKQAITRHDIRHFIDDGVIKKLPAKKNQIKKRKSQQKTGSKKGSAGARQRKKGDWLKIVRPQRRMLKGLKKDLKPGAYRKLYRLVKGDAFRSKAHLRLHIEKEGLLKKAK